MTRSVLSPANFESADVDSFLAEVLSRPYFDEKGGDIFVARAPGRLDLMGGIADYSGSLVLQWPLREATLVAVQSTDHRRLHAVSLGPGDELRTCDIGLDELFPDGQPLEYGAAQRVLSERTSSSWPGYVMGVFLVLAREKNWRPSSGFRLLIRSDVPEGKGVSSSAAIEVATLQAVAAAVGMIVDPREGALLAQMVENRIVGAACGVMDQMTSSCGVSGRLLSLLCQPAELRGAISLPDELEIWGLDSGVRHAVSGSDYTSVRVAAFMGARILAERAGLRATVKGPGIVHIDDARWNGYLANVTPAELESGTLGALPESLLGAEFLEEYGGITDTVTRVDPGRAYAVRACASHPIYENARVHAFAALLQGPQNESTQEALGQLMYQSHASYSACGLGAEATDALVELVRSAGAGGGFFGAKITGGGSGGTVAVLGRRGADVSRIVRAYAERSGHNAHVFSGTSSGSGAFGAVRLGHGD